MVAAQTYSSLGGPVEVPQRHARAAVILEGRVPPKAAGEERSRHPSIDRIHHGTQEKNVSESGLAEYC